MMLPYVRRSVGRRRVSPGIEGARKEGEHKQQAPPELLEEVFELNESLDELREAKASGRRSRRLEITLESAEEGFPGKARRTRRALQTPAREWTPHCKAKPPRRNRSWRS